MVKHYIKCGPNSYMFWNLSLLKGGVSRWGWSQNSLITVDTANKTFQYNHEYYLIRHLSHYVQPGAKLLRIGGRFQNLLAFKNPDQSIILVVQNDSDKDVSTTFRIGGKLITADLKGGSFNTMLLNKGF